MRVAQKVETIREDLGRYGTVLAEEVEEAMLGRATRCRASSRPRPRPNPCARCSSSSGTWRSRSGDLLEQYRETQRELRLSPDNIRKVVEVGLALAGQPALIPIEDPSGKPVFRLPASEASWAACAEGLEHPHTKDIRPITFDHAAAEGRDDMVLVHLNHRLVQMCLRLLRAEVWSEKGRKRLHRITARIVPEPCSQCACGDRPCPAGRDRRRQPPAARRDHHGRRDVQGRPVSRLNVGQIGKAAGRRPPTTKPSSRCRSTCSNCGTEFAPSLGQSLEARMKDRTSGLQKKLGERAEKEAKDIESILLELKKAIDTELKDPEYQQLTLFDDPEKEQFERNKDFLRDRSKAIPAEIKRETAAIRSRYADPQPRMFPVAVTFLSRKR